MKRFQERVWAWIKHVFPRKVCEDPEERAWRFLEEALELVQAYGLTREKAFVMLDYVYNRPAGLLPQEVGGVLVTLAGLCSVAQVDMELAGELELHRCWTRIGDIRNKQVDKPDYIKGNSTGIPPDYIGTGR